MLFIVNFIKKHRQILLILTITIIAYLNSLLNGFVWDDWPLIVENEVYTNLDIKSILFTKANSVEYLPIRDLTLLLDVLFWGSKPFGFHLTNLFLYLVSLIALYITLLRLTSFVDDGNNKMFAFWSTLVFALHPLHVEAVSFITARNNIIAGLFLFISFNYFLKGLDMGRYRYFFISIFMFTLALFSKASVLFYPLFLMAFLYIINGKYSLRPKIVAAVLLFFIIDALGYWVHFVNALDIKALNPDFMLFAIDNTSLQVAKAVQIPFFYLWKFIFPYPLTIYYPVNFLSDGYLIRSIISSIAVVMLLFTVIAYRKKHTLPVIGIIWFFFSLIPVLNLLPTAVIVADRYAYLPVLGPAILLAWLIIAFADKVRFSIYILFVILVIWGLITMGRNSDWSSDIALMESSVKFNPKMKRRWLADSLWKEERYEEALEHLKQEKLLTGSFNYTLFLGKQMYERGNYIDAVNFFKTALAEGGDAYKEPHLWLARAYESNGDNMLALSEYLKVPDSTSVDLYSRYDKVAYEGAQRIRQIFVPDLKLLRQRALDNPSNFQSQSNLALYLQKLGLYNEAEEHYIKSTEINPDSWIAYYNLGLVYMKLGRYFDAVQSFKQSISLNPDNTNAYNNVGISFVKLKDYHSAERYFKRALKIDNYFYKAAFNIARLYFSEGDKIKAKEYFILTKELTLGDQPLHIKIDKYMDRLN